MAFFTRHRLKIHLDEDGVWRATLPLQITGDYEDIMGDLELWGVMPNAMGNVCAVAAAFITRSWPLVLVLGLCGYLIGAVVRELRFSQVLNVVFPTYLGSPILSGLAAVGAAFYLVPSGRYLVAVALGAWVAGGALGGLSILELLVLPLRLCLRGLWTSRLGGHPMTWVERSLIILCEDRARKRGVELHWDRYPDPHQVHA